MTPEKREKQRLRTAEYRSRNPEKVREINRKSQSRLEYRSRNKVYQQEYRERNREILVMKERERRFGITHAEYAALHKNQSGLCAICQQPERQKRSGKVKSLAVDHDHKTGAVRGLLCSDCNTGIGKLKDDCAILDSAIRYLKGSN